jgi:uncharacterized protein (TIGR03083 family)
MASDDPFEGFDPVDAMDDEAARIEEHLDRLPAADWLRPSRCAGWTVRDVLAHLAASEDYHHACLDGRVRAFMREMEERGATDIAAFNALGIADLERVANDELVQMWSRSNAETRQRFRERGDGEVDTSVGLYPSRWQAFHLAGELATHADDIFVPIPPADRSSRREWRARFSRFALAESKPELTIETVGTHTRVAGDGVEIEVSDDDLIEAVAGRAPSTQLDARVRTVLSTMP